MRDLLCDSSAMSTASAGRKSYTARFEFRAGLVLLILGLVDIILARRVHLEGLMQCADIWPSVLLLLACLWYCRWRPLPRLVDSCELTLWAILLIDALSLLVQIAGRSPYPLVDHQLNAIDAAFHFRTAGIVHALDAVRPLSTPPTKPSGNLL